MQKKGEKLTAYFIRFYKYLKKHETAVKREVAIKYAKAQASKLKPLIPELAVVPKEKASFIKEASRVDAFIKWLRSKQHRSHFLITKSSTMEEVWRTVIHIARKGQWIYITSDKRHESDSSSSNSSDTDSDPASNNSDSSMEEDFIKMKLINHSKKKHTSISWKDEGISIGHSVSMTSNSKRESSEIDSLIKQFGEIKILLAEAVTEVDKLEQSKNNCKNCRSSTYTTSNYNQPCVSVFH